MSSIGEYRIIFWNARGVRGKYTELIDLLQTDEIDIACINETFLDDNAVLPCIPGYNIVRLDKSNHSGGLLFIIKNNINFSIIDHQTTQLFEVGAVRINAALPFIIFLIYCPGGTANQMLISNNFQSELKEMCRNSLPFFIIGDFNAKHRSWNCTRPNKSGRLLFEFLNNNSIFLSYPDTHSYNPTSSRMSPSTIDLMLTDGRIPSSPLRTVEQLTSDHFPIQFEINCSKGPATYKTTFDYSRADWDGFGTHISQLLNPILEQYNNQPQSNNADIDNIISLITSAILDAQDLNIPTIPTNNNSTSFSATPLLRALISARNYFRRRFTRSHNQLDKFIFNELKKKVNLEISNILNAKYSKILLDCNQQHNKIYKVIKNRKHVNLPNINPLTPGDRKHVSLLSKAEVIADNFEKNHNNPLANSLVNHTRIINDSVKSYLNSPPHNPEECPPIHINEVATTIKLLKINKAAGLDKINTRLIKRLPVVAIHLLSLTFSMCINNSYFPDTWKIAKTIPIPKPGKDRRDVTSYRPIALLSCLGKLFERIINSRLYAEMEFLDCIPNTQFGFRRQHSTVHALTFLTSHIKSAFRMGKTTAALYFDVAKAFDSVWHNGLIHKMIQVGFSDWIIRLTASFLKDRLFEVHVGEAASRRRSTPFGVPQGSVLSPSLYNIFVHDIPSPSWGKIIMYADDTVIVASCRFIKRLVKHIKKSAKNVISYYKKWKISVNNEKTVLMFHTRRRRRQLPPDHIILNGTRINKSHSVKYLGVHLDNGLTLRNHISKTVIKTDNICKLLYPILGRHSFASKKLKLKIYKTYIRPALLYAAPLLDSVAAKHKKQLQIKQNKILRLILRRDTRTRIVDLHDSANLQSIDCFLAKLKNKFSQKCRSSSNVNIVNLS